MVCDSLTGDDMEVEANYWKKRYVESPATSSGDDDSSGSDEDSSDDDDDPIRAPIELLGEFIQYIRGGEWENAKKLCTMILIYEPDNELVTQFQSLIEDKLQQAAEESEDESSSGEEDSSDDESDDDAACGDKNDDKSSENGSKDGEDDHSSSDDDDDDRDLSAHLRNRLIFSHGDKSVSGPWRP